MKTDDARRPERPCQASSRDLPAIPNRSMAISSLAFSRDEKIITHLAEGLGPFVKLFWWNPKDVFVVLV